MAGEEQLPGAVDLNLNKVVAVASQVAGSVKLGPGAVMAPGDGDSMEAVVMGAGEGADVVSLVGGGRLMPAAILRTSNILRTPAHALCKTIPPRLSKTTTATTASTRDESSTIGASPGVMEATGPTPPATSS